MAAIQIERVTKVYDDEVTAVDDVSLEVSDGEFMVLVGPSGCGKSTLLRVIAGLEQVTAGRVLIGDDDVTGLDPADRDIAMVFQSYALYPHKTVRENLAFGLRRRRVEWTRSRAGSTRWPRCSASASFWTGSPRRCQGASASESRWDGHWSASLACSSWTSRSQTWTPSCARVCAVSSRGYTSGFRQPPST